MFKKPRTGGAVLILMKGIYAEPTLLSYFNKDWMISSLKSGQEGCLLPFLLSYAVVKMISNVLKQEKKLLQKIKVNIKIHNNNMLNKKF